MKIRELSEKCLSRAMALDMVTKLYDHVNYQVVNGVLTGKKKYSLYEASMTAKAEKILILDADGLVVNGVSKYTLVPIDSELVNLTHSESREFEKIAKRFGVYEKTSSFQKMFKGKVFKPTYRLEVEFEEMGIDWKEFIHELINYRAEKDPKLATVFKALLLRGFVMKYAPHSIVATNPSTGKSAFLGHVGKRYEKVSANSLVGYSKGNDEIHRGVVDEQKFCITIEEIEAQMFTNFFSFLLTFLEEGKATVSTAGVEFSESGVFPFAITANPTAVDVNKEDSARLLFTKLSTNHLALGRRIGLLIFGNKYKQVVSQGSFNDDEWSLFFELYRAIEEKCAAAIMHGIYLNPDVEKWLETPISGYNQDLLKSFQVQDDVVRDFLSAHFDSAFRHIRGGALAIAIVDNMDQILQVAELKTEIPKVMREKIMQDAEAALEELKEINLESIANMVTTIQKTDELTQTVYRSLPKPLREVVLLVQKIKEGSPNTITFPISRLDYPLTFYTTTDLLLKGLSRIRMGSFDDILAGNFGFTIETIKNEPTIILKDKEKIIMKGSDPTIAGTKVAVKAEALKEYDDGGEKK